MQVVVTAIEGAAALNTVMLLDALHKANVAHRFLNDPAAPDALDVSLVALGPEGVRFQRGVSADARSAEDARPDLVVVPGLDDDVRPSVQRNLDWIPWLQRWHQAGATIASSCTGAFLLAEAGLLNGRRATTHWVAAPQLQAAYPEIQLDIDQIVIDEGDVITSGGATTALNLVYYLVDRFGSSERAAAAAQMMLLDGGRDSQLPFARLGLLRNHDDPLVHAAQSALQQGDLPRPTVEQLAHHVGASPRTLARRFSAAIGVSPKTYLDRLRVESAKRLLEQADPTVDHIAHHIGFTDITAFRRAFKRHAGVSPSDYRRRFARQPRHHATRS